MSFHIETDHSNQAESLKMYVVFSFLLVMNINQKGNKILSAPPPLNYLPISSKRMGSMKEILTFYFEPSGSSLY